MASRRAPLADVPDAVNSPFRTAPAAGGKRTRTQAGDQREVVHGQPPSKKHIVEIQGEEDENTDPRRRSGVPATTCDKFEEPFAKRSQSTQPTAFEKKLASVREKKPATSQQRVERPQKQDGSNLESIRQWQRHYRRQFPQFVFYFESVADDVRAKSMRSIAHLGAREEKFFSKAVTHVVTTRSIPPERTSTSPDETKYEAAPTKSVQPTSTSTQDQRRTTNLLDAHLQRRSQNTVASVQPSVESRRPAPHSADILTKARALGIKIWALEKLHRVLDTILDADAGDNVIESRPAATGTRATSRNTHDADLEQLLRHEKVNGPTDRDMTVATQDMTTLRGYYIYIHDMDEKSKPVMVRDYPKTASKEDGKWPQFRLSAAGRCPFVEDPAHTKRLQQQGRASTQAFTESAQRKTRAGGTSLAAPSQLLGERDSNLRRSPRKLAQPKHESAKPLDPPRALPSMRHSSTDLMPPLYGSAQAILRGPPRMVGGEPVASGIQHSNVTSAIRSQAISSAAISSTAPGIGMRAGDTKEMLSLKRKVFASKGTPMPTSYANDVRGAINNDDSGPPPRAAKRKAQETLGVVIEGDEAGDHLSRSKAAAPKRKKVVEKEAKPGYCENCRDKFDDFDDHIATRKHRKFAMTNDNWRDLDALLGLLKRPHKKH
uniref:Related to DBF4-regulatory subunit for Cdc7p protein kinase n=1 Tax=Ramularia collo-cygni TaxID=112498 RepID=A0A2D3UQM3_9PEZI